MDDILSSLSISIITTGPLAETLRTGTRPALGPLASTGKGSNEEAEDKTSCETHLDCGWGKPEVGMAELFLSGVTRTTSIFSSEWAWSTPLLCERSMTSIPSLNSVAMETLRLPGNMRSGTSPSEIWEDSATLSLTCGRVTSPGDKEEWAEFRRLQGFLSWVSEWVESESEGTWAKVSSSDLVLTGLLPFLTLLSSSGLILWTRLGVTAWRGEGSIGGCVVTVGNAFLLIQRRFNGVETWRGREGGVKEVEKEKGRS